MNQRTRSDHDLVTPRSRQTARVRRGMAVLLTLIAIILLAVLSTGAVMGSMQEFRAGRNSMVEQRAFAVAEFVLLVRRPRRECACLNR